MAKVIGEVECDRKACDGTADVFRFEMRSGRGSVFRNKYWMKCRKCSGVSGRQGEQSVTEYILEKGKLWGDQSREPEPAPAPTPAQPAATPAPKTPAKDGSQPIPQPARKAGWGPLIQ